MILKDKVQHWLKMHSLNYAAGVVLFEEIRASGFKSGYASIILSGESSFALEKLSIELQRYLDNCGPNKLVQTPSTDEPVRQKQYGDYNVQAFPNDLKELHREIKRLYGHLALQKGRLRDIFYKPSTGDQKQSPNERQAKTIAFDILETDKVIKAAWARLDFYQEHGAYMPGTEPKNIDEKTIRFWLANQVAFTDYCRKADINKKKKGSYSDLAKYEERKAVLNEIKQYYEQ